MKKLSRYLKNKKARLEMEIAFFLQDISRKIKKAREEEALTQQEVADKLGISAETYARRERTGNMLVKQLFDIVWVLNRRLIIKLEPINNGKSKNHSKNRGTRTKTKNCKRN